MARITPVCCAVMMHVVSAILFVGFPMESEAQGLPQHDLVRLKPGLTSPNEGMLQVYHQKFWGYVCYDNWTEHDADVACRHLGYTGTHGYHAMAASSDELRRRFQGIYLQDVHCLGSEESLWDCGNARVGYYDETCISQHVVWLGCTNDEDDATEIPTTTTTATTDIPEPPVVEAVIITHDSVSLDWREWAEYTERSSPELYVVRYLILYRPAGDPTINFTLGDEIFGYFKSGTVEYLTPRTTYEFKVETIRLDPTFVGESVGMVSPVVTATTTCNGPNPVGDVAIASVLPRQLKVTWSMYVDEDCPPDSVIVEYKLLIREQCRRGSGSALDGTLRVHDNNSVDLNDLHPYSTYAVNVSVRNHYGRSVEIPLVVNTTQSEPSGVPRNIETDYHSGTSGFNSGPRTLTASWDQPPCGERNGRITGYTYMLLDVQTDEVIKSGATQISIVHLPNVDPMKRYKFLVAAKTVAGMGPYGAASVHWQFDITEICGQQNQRFSTRVSGGMDSRKGEFPWMAQIWHIKRGKKFCAGSILDDHWIITAAHCITSYNITQSDVRVQLGDYDTMLPEPQQRVYDVDRIRVHVGFNRELFDDDIALIHVREPIEFSDHIKPICLPDKKIARNLLRPGDHKYGTVAGWGKDRDGNLPRYLKQVTLPIVDRSECRRATNYSFTANMFCAGFRTAGEGETCKGDSGGPFMVRRNGKFFIAGLISWGNPVGCDTESDQYGYYTRIFKYMGWIKSIHPAVSIVKH